MKGKDVREIREKLGLSAEQFAELLCLAGYQSVMNIESDFRKPSKLAIRLLRYLDDQQKKKALEFIEEFRGYEPK
jgi:DNA-binding transcriptional regulator YiaG